MEAVKLRGSDTGLNLILINGFFYKVSPDLVSFEMIVTGEDIKNIAVIGYSKPLKQLYVQMRNNKSYIYTDVTLDKWQVRHNHENLSLYWNNEIRGHSFFQTENEIVQSVSNQYVLDAYMKLEYYQTITLGMWATDRPDLVIDPENVLFQLEP